MIRRWRRRAALLGLGLTWLLGCFPGQASGQPRFELGLQGGYRQDSLDWTIAGNVDVLSELEWTELDIYQLQLTLGLLSQPILPGARLAGRALFGVGRIVAGDNRDSDYAGNQRSLEFSRSNNDAGDGRVYDLSLAGGLQFEPTPGLQLTPLFGWSHHEQQLVLQGGVQTLSQPQLVAHTSFSPPALGPFPGLDSSYDARWYGPWVGCDLNYQFSPRWRLSGTAELHWGEMKAEADWNLRSDFAHPVSFRQIADAYGLVLGVAGNYALDERWILHLGANYSDWWTDPGLDQIYFADGQVGNTRLNEVNWHSLALLAGLQYRFP
jgi:outer membrane protease